jgi:hypothetical protein
MYNHHMTKNEFIALLDRLSAFITLSATAKTVTEKRIALTGLHNVWIDLAHANFGDPLDPTTSN